MGRAAHVDGPDRGGSARAGRRSAAIAWWPTCRTASRRSRACWRARRWGRRGRRARRTSARAAWSTASRRSSPKVLLAVDGYRYNGRDFDSPRHRRRPAARDAVAAGDGAARLPRRVGDAATGRSAGTSSCGPEGSELAFEQVAFDHPLWVLYSSGTTGLPKAIVQGQGGILHGAAEAPEPARRRAGGRPRLLVHHDRLDDVELPRRLPADRGLDRPLRRQPGLSGHDRALGPRRRGADHRRSARARATSPRA